MIQIGALVAKPGSIERGWLDAVQLPTGGLDRFPIIIAQGEPAGPVLWLTTGLHGDEHTGMVVIHKLLTEQLVSELYGTIVAVTSLNPAGIRTRSREAYYYRGDPNRRFPDPLRSSGPTISAKLSSLDAAFHILYESIAESEPAALIDMHNAWIGSVPFAFRDPVFYGRYVDSSSRLRTKRDADHLNERNGRFLQAFGFPVINEYVARSYIDKQLHRSLSGSVLNGLNVPTMTVELGSWMYVQNIYVEAALAGIRNALRFVGMLESPLEQVESLPLAPVDKSLRRVMHPITSAAGIIELLVEPGQFVNRLQKVATLRDIHGQPAGTVTGSIITEYDGYVLGRSHGAVRYQGEAVLALAVPDDISMVVSTGT